MPPSPLPSRLSSLTLVHLLQQWVPVEGASGRLDAAQRLGEWLNAFDSVKLDAALQTIASYGAQARQKGQAVHASPLAALCQQIKADLADLIAHKVASVGDTTAEQGYGPHLQRYGELQKQMASKVAACREQVRQALGKGSPALRQLAALDGVMAQLLGEREQKLLMAVPVYLERRFEHWRQQPADASLPGFQHDMKQMLLAELHVRLQPVLGLIEAVQHENRQQLA